MPTKTRELGRDEVFGSLTDEDIIQLLEECAEYKELIPNFCGSCGVIKTCDMKKDFGT